MTKNLHHGHGLIALGVGAGAVSAGLNLFHIAHVAVWMIPIVALTESARIYLPFVAASHGWNTFLKTAFGAVMLLCLITSTQFLADTFVMKLLGRGKQEDVAAQKVAKIAKLEADIAAITEKLSSKKLNEMVAEEKGRKDKPGCGTKCLDYQERAGKAERREKLEAELAELTKSVETASVIETNGLGLLVSKASCLSEWTCMDVEQGTMVVMSAGGASLIYTLDLLVYLVILGTQMVRREADKAKLSALGVEITVTKEVESGKKVTKEQAYQFVISKLLEQPEGSMLTSRRQLAPLAGVSKTTFCTWMNDWVKTGKLNSVPKSKHRELISLPKAA